MLWGSEITDEGWRWDRQGIWCAVESGVRCKKCRFLFSAVSTMPWWLSPYYMALSWSEHYLHVLQYSPAAPVSLRAIAWLLLQLLWRHVTQACKLTDQESCVPSTRSLHHLCLETSSIVVPNWVWWRVWNGVHLASWVQLRSYLEEK
jgi:hypothetical protein